MKFNLQGIIFFSIFFVFAFLFGVIVHGLISAILIFLILFFIVKISLSFSVILSIVISGTINMIFNFRVFMEALIVEIENREGLIRYWNDIFEKKRDKEKFRSSVSIEVNNKKYRIVEFAEYFFDPRAKNKQDLKGFLIFSEENKKEVIDEFTKRKVLGIYLFWRHIYFDNILGKIPLKPNSKRIFKYQLKFQEAFKKQISKRMRNNYLEMPKLKNKDYLKILKDLDQEVYKQYPLVKEKLEIQIDIFNSLYTLFTKPSSDLYNELVKKIEHISELSREENKIWCHRLTTWKKLVRYYDLKIDNLPKPNFKKVGISALFDLLRYSLTKKKPIISEETIGDLFIEGTKIPRKKVLKYLNNYFVLHKTGIDAIELNIEVNKKFKELAEYHNNLLNNPPLEKIRN